MFILLNTDSSNRQNYRTRQREADDHDSKTPSIGERLQAKLVYPAVPLEECSSLQQKKRRITTQDQSFVGPSQVHSACQLYPVLIFCAFLHGSCSHLFYHRTSPGRAHGTSTLYLTTPFILFHIPMKKTTRKNQNYY